MLLHRWLCNYIKLNYSVQFAGALLYTMFLCRELASAITDAANWIAHVFPVFI